ncbi:MAG: helix-turn-helix transcriptional regulator [Coxiellaceae bacterium]|nr:helix-turn-helix transcriptional regulator [Coxiellaceae bacterium]
MKGTTLTDVIKNELKNKDFAAAYERELLINGVAKLIISLRKSKNLTQQQLADKVGTSQSVIARLETGSVLRVPSLDMLNRIAIATKTKINISFDDL